mgnify:FL=1
MVDYMRVKDGKKNSRGSRGVLTAQQIRFARLIFEGKAPKEAYIGAGYSMEIPSQVNNRTRFLLAKKNIREEIERLQHDLLRRSSWDAFRVFKEYTELFNVAKGEDGLFHDRPTALRCLEMLSKFIGMHVERRELTLKLGSPSDDPKVLDDQITQLARLVGREDIIPLIELDPSKVIDITSENVTDSIQSEMQPNVSNEVKNES